METEIKEDIAENRLFKLYPKCIKPLPPPTAKPPKQATSYLNLPLHLKRCYKCGEIKERTEYHKHRSRYDGIDARCKTCANKRRMDPVVKAKAAKKYYLKNKDRIAAYEKARRQKNKLKQNPERNKC